MAAVTSDMSDICYGFDGLPLILGEKVWCVDSIYGYKGSLNIGSISGGGVTVVSPDGFILVVVDPMTLSHTPFPHNHGR